MISFDKEISSKIVDGASLVLDWGFCSRISAARNIGGAFLF